MPDDEIQNAQKLAATSAHSLIETAAQRTQQDRWFFPNGVDHLKLETKVELPNDIGVSLSIELRGPSERRARNQARKGGLRGLQLTPNVIYAFQDRRYDASPTKDYIYVLSAGDHAPSGYLANHEYWFVHTSIDKLSKLPSSDMWINRLAKSSDPGGLDDKMEEVESNGYQQLAHPAGSEWNTAPVAKYLRTSTYFYEGSGTIGGSSETLRLCFLPGDESGTDDRLDGVVWLESTAPSTHREPHGFKLSKQTNAPDWSALEWHVCL